MKSKISIVSHKVQTTQEAIKGIINISENQLIFIDTPGIFGSNKRLSRNTKKRHEIAEFYKENLERFPLILPPNYENNYSGMHLYVVRIDKTNRSIS